MKTKLYAGLKYENSTNIGDYIQSIATERLLPKISIRFDRDTLSTITKRNKKYILITNGWFSHTPEKCFPFAPCIYPLFFGFHITSWNNTWEHILQTDGMEYLRKYIPVGCRDQYTANRLIDVGLEAYNSKCLTLTLPKRNSIPPKTTYVIVDAFRANLPPCISNKAVFFTHFYQNKKSERDSFDLSKQLLSFYRRKATVIITTRLHCALPCLAMGIPVVFFGDKNDYRISILTDIGVRINSYGDELRPNFWEESMNSINFELIDKVKNEMIVDLKRRLDELS